MTLPQTVFCFLNLCAGDGEGGGDGVSGSKDEFEDGDCDDEDSDGDYPSRFVFQPGTMIEWGNHW